MNDKEKQIEEMADILCESKNHNCNGEDCKCIKQATDLYNAGYQKIPEGSVVLTEEEYGKLKAENEDLTIYIKDYKFRNQELQKANEGLAKNIGELEIEADELRDKLTQAPKQTVKKFAKRLKKQFEHTLVVYSTSSIEKRIDELAKKFGVEL